MMGVFTEADQKRLQDIRIAMMFDMDKLVPPFGVADVRLLVDRIDDLSPPDLLCAEDLMQWTRDRLEEDLREKRGWLAEQIEQVRIAELQVKEAEHALTAVQALVDGGMFASGEEINQRWDAMTALYAAQGMLPAPEEPPALEAPPEAVEPASEPPPEPAASEPQPEEEPEAAAPKPKIENLRPTSGPVDQADQERRMYEALRTVADGEPQVQVRLKVLAELSGVALGSSLPVLRRLADAGRIEISKGPVVGKVQAPNIYRFIEGATAAPPPKAEPEIAEAWSPPPNRPGGFTPKEPPPLRDRILKSLKVGACTCMGLASMLGEKEMAVSQTLSVLKHEGAISCDDVPESGRRAQLWRAVTEPSEA